MEQIIAYKVVSGYWVKPKFTKMATLDEEVREAINDGWKPLGGAFTIQSLSSDQMGIPMLGQAMVKQ